MFLSTFIARLRQGERGAVALEAALVTPILLIVVLGVVAYRYRVKLLARILGQPERRIERQLGRKKNH